MKDAQKILKNIGISDFSFQEACSKLSKISDEAFTKPIIEALRQELEFSKLIGVPSLLTSDLIESLFGKYKATAKPHKLSEINKSVLSLPCFCEEITQKLIDRVFTKITNKEVEKWIKRYIPITLLSRRIRLVKEMKTDQEIIELYPYRKDAESNEVYWAS